MTSPRAWGLFKIDDYAGFYPFLNVGDLVILQNYIPIFRYETHMYSEGFYYNYNDYTADGVRQSLALYTGPSECDVTNIQHESFLIDSEIIHVRRVVDVIPSVSVVRRFNG